MQRAVRIFIVLFLILAAAAVAGVEYLNRVVLPVKVRGWAETQLTNALGRTVTIGQVRLHLWHGAVIEDITVEEDARYGKQPFLQIDRISGRILYLPILKDRRIIVPSLSIVRPRIRLLQDPNGVWNFQSIQTARKTGPSPQAGMQFLIPKVVLVDGQLEVAMEQPTPALRFNFQELDAQIGLALPAKVEWGISTHLVSKQPIPIRLEGSFELGSREIRVRGRLEPTLESILEYLPPQSRTILSRIEGSSLLDLEATGRWGNSLTLKGLFQTQGLRWESRYPGHGELKLTLTGGLTHQSNPTLRNGLSGFLELDRITVESVPSVGEVRDLTGKIKVQWAGGRTLPWHEVERLTAMLPTGQPLEMSGSLSSDDRQTLTLRCITHSALDRMPPLNPAIEIALKTLKAQGQADIEATVEGPLRPSPSLRTTVTATLQNGSCLLPTGDSIEEAAGTLRWQPDLLTVTGFGGQFRKEPFQLEGSLVNFARPEIDARLSWGPLKADGQLTIDGERLEIETITGQLGNNGTFRLFGEVQGLSLGLSPSQRQEVAPKGTVPELLGNLYGECTFLIEELPALSKPFILRQAQDERRVEGPNPPAWAQQLPLRGEVSTRWQLKGPLAKPMEWDLGLKAASDPLTYLPAGTPRREIPLERVTIDARQVEGRLTINSSKAQFAGGTIQLAGTAWLNDPKKPWAATLDGSDLELAILSQHLNWETKDLSGQLFLNGKGQGDGSGLASIQGSGGIQVRGGRILQLPLLGSFAELLKLPTLRTIVFQEAQGPFTLGGGALETDSFQLTAPQATLTIVGSGGFLKGADSPIHWKIFPTLSPELIPEESRSKIGKAIVQGTSYLVGEIQITGTWKNPKRNFVPKPFTQILNEQLFNVQDLLKDLF